ncbi:glycosyltransferase family 32 protein [Fibrobacter intestinalis]|uniref:glycosyltransferase family 32 protein n=1 Tax=Fibrobacter intestinalis TaxID=28122 RepID=UPI0023F19F37|nr:glycosyltransferase [Fibrobacter intestinalis]MDD7298544.1 glycosyltransferase [Fibrobacter intestinalis]
MSIPKKIHYLWISETKTPAVERCLASWKKHLNDYEIMEWNSTNFPYSEFLFAKEAFSKKKWAFVTDYFRLWVLEKFGGIYLDADVTVNDNFDKFLEKKLFIGTEFTDQIAAHVIGAEAGHPFLRRCLEYYKDRHFILPDGSCDMNAMPCIITKVFMNNYKYDGPLVNFDGKPLEFSDMTIYPDSYFTINVFDGHNVCVHNGLGSWRDTSSENPVLENVVGSYFWKKFCRKDIGNIRLIKKIVYLMIPMWMLVLFSKRSARIGHNKRVAKIRWDR